MVCSACQRAKPPKPPNPASSHLQYLGQFADHVQADIFYLRDMSSKNYPILGMICEATHLHAAIRLESRQPIHVAKALREAWIRNFGFPLRLSVDDDGAFKSDFMNFCDEGGTFVDFIPPEAHYKLGTIERHNDTLRMHSLQFTRGARQCHRVSIVRQERSHMELRQTSIHRCLWKDTSRWTGLHHRSSSSSCRIRPVRHAATSCYDEM